MKEIWKDIETYSDYQVSNFGRVRSKLRIVKILLKTGKLIYRTYYPKIMKPSISNGYFGINLRHNNKYIRFKISRLVATAFIENRFNKDQINHINGIKLDDKVTNLEWCTHSENVRHAIKLGLKKSRAGISNTKLQGEKNSYSKLNELQVRIIRKLKGDIPYKEISVYFNVSWQLIGRIINKNCWKHLN